jgi:hypothetical protein
MQLTRKTGIAIFALCLLCFALGGYTFTNISLDGHRSPQAKANVFMFKESARGYEEIATGNVITDIGETYIRNAIGFNNVTGMDVTKYISLGNASVAQTLTKLTTEATTGGFTRATGTVDAWVNSGDSSYNVTKKFTASATMTINAAGLHWIATGDSSDNLFAAGAITQTTFNANDNCTIVWSITINAND